MITTALATKLMNCRLLVYPIYLKYAKQLRLRRKRKALAPGLDARLLRLLGYVKSLLARV